MLWFEGFLLLLGSKHSWFAQEENHAYYCFAPPMQSIRMYLTKPDTQLCVRMHEIQVQQRKTIKYIIPFIACMLIIVQRYHGLNSLLLNALPARMQCHT